MTLKTQSFCKGTCLFEEGEPGTEAYLITSGFVTVSHEESGVNVSLGTRSEGDIVGEMALIERTVRSATVTAGSDVETKVITQEELDSLMTQAPETLQLILTQLLESLRTSNDLVAMYAAQLQENTD
jgi:CRP-like cAMP-binding protein